MYIKFAQHEKPLKQTEELRHLSLFYTNKCLLLRKQVDHIKAANDTTEEEYKIRLKSEQAQVDGLFYENRQFRQQIKSLKNQLSDSDKKYSELLKKYQEKDDTEYDTEYDTDSSYTDDTEGDTTTDTEGNSEDDIETIKTKVNKIPKAVVDPTPANIQLKQVS